MNLMERKMVDCLKDLRDNHSVIGVKMEFEAEGTRLEEAMRLKEVSMSAGLTLTTKVGGCEAVKDMFDAGALGTRYLVGPMVESPYALKKFIQATRIAFPHDLHAEMDFYINLETITAVKNFDEMLEIPEAKELDGIVLGRVDLTGSMNLDRASVNSPEVLDICLSMAAKAKAKGKKVIVGGAVSVHSMNFFKAFPPGHIDKFETRKIVFGCPEALKNTEAAFLKAVEFELMWLKNKKNYYGSIYSEDDSRLKMMEDRYRISIDQMPKEIHQ
ncbi:MAG: aldolase/citrate lyase family protein [Pseudobdellovibrionaceae bacterium]